MAGIIQFLFRTVGGHRSGRNHFTEDFVRKNNYRPGYFLRKKLKKAWGEYITTIADYPDNFSGKGIIVCAGGLSYTTCAWVNISMLRRRGCVLPVELWYDGEELSEDMVRQFGKLDVICRRCSDSDPQGAKGFAIKPFAILHSRFREVLLLDADNNCMKDPSYLFQTEAYRKYGAIFWPDYWTTDKSNAIWDIVGAEADDRHEQESGQLLIDKERCWSALNLCMYFNRQSRYYYQMLLGDKDTFRFAWTSLKKSFYMIPTPPGMGGFLDKKGEFFGMSMAQHDVDGNILFIHRNMMKWDITQNDEILWTHIRRRREPAEPAKFRPRWLRVGNASLHFSDIEGDIETLSFHQLFDDYENECLEVLSELRRSGTYSEFMVYLYLLNNRPGGAIRFTDHIKSFSFPQKK